MLRLSPEDRGVMATAPHSNCSTARAPPSQCRTLSEAQSTTLDQIHCNGFSYVDGSPRFNGSHYAISRRVVLISRLSYRKQIAQGSDRRTNFSPSVYEILQGAESSRGLSL